MRNPNRYGTIKKLSGKRRRPFAVYITTSYEPAKSLPDISFLKRVLEDDLFAQVEAACERYEESLPTDYKQKQKAIGYYATRQEAMIALAEYNKSPYDISGRDTTFAQVYDEIYRKDICNMKPSSKKAYVTAYDKCDSIKQMKMKELRLNHLQAIVDAHSDKSKSTQNTIVVLFHSIYRYAIEHDIVDRDYSSYVKLTSTVERSKKNPYTKEEIRTLWNNLDWLPPASNRENALTGIPMMDSLLVMIYTGVRIGELLEIKPEDVHLNEKWIDIRGTKTKAARRAVPIHGKILPLVEARMNNCKGKYLFADKNGEKLDYGKYKAQFTVFYWAAFGHKHTPHECRHTFITVAAASGMNQILVKKMVGHASSDITENVYTHAYIEDLVAEIDKFNL